MNTLSLGSRGPMVQLLQAALQRAGFDPGTVDGIFGVNTQNAVISFQSANGLTPDGIVGKNTWAALQPYLTGYVRRTIVSGDTYFKLAEKYGTTVNAIARANPQYDPQNLPLGSELIIPLSFNVVFTNIYYTSAVTELVINGLLARFPFISREIVGESVLGKPLYALKIGTGEKEVFYNASHHANEWITTPVVLRFIEQYCGAIAAGRAIGGVDAAQLSREVTLYVMPLVNPDGVDLVTGYIPPNSREYQAAQAINTPPLRFPLDWKANIRGVDLNLQYPAGWENAREIKFAQGYTKPGPRDFVGEAPLDQPESRAVADFTRRHNFALTLSYHTQGEVIYWKYADYEPENSYRIGVAFSNASGYTLELTPYNSGFAGYKDWFIQEYNRPGYTIECGRGVSPLPLSQFAEIYRDNLPIMLLGMVLS